MSAPTKPWEGGASPALLNASSVGPDVSPSFQNTLMGGNAQQPGYIATPAPPPPPPPLPPLQDLSQIGMGSGMGLYNSGMGSYGYGSGSYGMGNSYMGGMGYGGGYMGGMGGYMGTQYSPYNRYGAGMYGDPEGRLIAMAEENARPAFESIQSVVHAVGSVAAMLDNTFLALTSSFRAILGVAENFGRLRGLFAQVWSAIFALRWLNKLMHKLMLLMGLRTQAEYKAWEQASAQVAGTAQAASSAVAAGRSGWPALLFFGTVAVAPYLLLRLIPALSSPNASQTLNDPSTWVEPLRAVAQYEYVSRSPQELSAKPGQVLWVAPEALQRHIWSSGWLMASADRKHAALIPTNYIKIIRPSHPTPNATHPIEDATPGSTKMGFSDVNPVPLNDAPGTEANDTDLLDKCFNSELQSQK